jgi:hypothetical protein
MRGLGSVVVLKLYREERLYRFVGVVYPSLSLFRNPESIWCNWFIGGEMMKRIVRDCYGSYDGDRSLSFLIPAGRERGFLS